MRFVKPLDENLVIELATRHRAFVTIEENAVAGGAGNAVGEALAFRGTALPHLQIGIPDRFIEHGSRESCLAAAGLDAASLSARIEQWWAEACVTRDRRSGRLTASSFLRSFPAHSGHYVRERIAERCRCQAAAVGEPGSDRLLVAASQEPISERA